VRVQTLEEEEEGKWCGCVGQSDIQSAVLDHQDDEFSSVLLVLLLLFGFSCR
jgi:hypothetical protein